MKEVAFKRDDQLLHGTLYGEGKAGLVLCPPHPLFGGNRYDFRLVAIAEELARHNIVSLCLDYSKYSGGSEEIKDVLATLSYLKERTDSLGLLGYSYGAVIASHAAVQAPVAIKGLVLLSLVKRIGALEADLSSECPKLMIYGLKDNFVAGDFEELYFKARGEKEKLVLETDHFYFGFEEIVSKRVRQFLQRCFGGGKEPLVI